MKFWINAMLLLVPLMGIAQKKVVKKPAVKKVVSKPVVAKVNPDLIKIGRAHV